MPEAQTENIEKGNRRPFATGSKPGPDELDHYLEQKGYYRKHVARDASSLFRCIAEQVLDIQNYYDKIRQDCASFMESHVKEYANEVDKNFYTYCSNLRKSRTYGTLLEVRVMARMYQRNVILFEPTQNFQTNEHTYVQCDDYIKYPPIRLYYSHKDKHFDSIFTMKMVQLFAEAQSIVYSCLYDKVFKLPDVKYATERMLHDQDEVTTVPLEDDNTKYKTASGEIFEFDTAESTCCVLKDPKTCHFHNQEDFEEVVEEKKDEVTIVSRTDDPNRLKIYKPIDGFLYKKDKSCVRQLLDEKITPFPYKVAKALDPSIYRNTEFELWSENRKEQRIKLLDSNGLPLRDDDLIWGTIPYDKNRTQYELRKFPFDNNDETYLSFDENGKRKYVLINPGDEYKYNMTTNLEYFQPSKEHLEQIVMPVNVFNGGRHNPNRNHDNQHNNGEYIPRRFNNHNNRRFNNHPNHQGYHGNQRQGQQQHMNYAADIERDNYHHQHNSNNGGDQEQVVAYNQQSQLLPPQQILPAQQHLPIHQQAFYQDATTGYQYIQYDPHSPPPIYQNPPPIYQYQPIPQSPFPHTFSAINYAPNAPGTQQFNSPAVMQFPYPPPGIPNSAPLFSYPPPNNNAIQAAASNTNNNRDSPNDSLNLIRESELNCGNINWNPKESVDPNGGDLPLNDTASLQFYFNIGVRYYYANGIQRRLETVASQIEGLNSNQQQGSSSDMNANNNNNLADANLESNIPAVPTNTPVSTKSLNFTGNNNSGQNRYHGSGSNNNNNNNNNRRPYGNNNNNNNNSGQNYRSDGNNNNTGGKGRNYHGNNGNYNNGPRKEIQFNSNVKNVHKADTNSTNSSKLGGSHHQNQHGGLQNSSSSNNDRAKEKPGNVNATVSQQKIEQQTQTQVVTPVTHIQVTADPVPNASSPIVDLQNGNQVQPMQTQYYNAQPYVVPTSTAYYAPQTPQIVYYHSENGNDWIPAYTQPQIQPVYCTAAYPNQPATYYAPQYDIANNTTMNSSDSGVIDVNGYAYQQQIYQPYIVPSPAPIYYPPPTPLLHTPQIAANNQVSPVFPIAGTVTTAAVAQTPNIVINNAGTVQATSTGINQQEQALESSISTIIIDAPSDLSIQSSAAVIKNTSD